MPADLIKKLTTAFARKEKATDDIDRLLDGLRDQIANEIHDVLLRYGEQSKDLGYHLYFDDSFDSTDLDLLDLQDVMTSLRLRGLSMCVVDEDSED